ncbi:MAG: thioredoxin family protein [Flavobacteriales bacterium]|nr:thioredoxin family protein [Flavobacteriales bacterium]
MKTIKVLGTGCAKCKSTIAAAEEAAAPPVADAQLIGGGHRRCYNILTTPRWCWMKW